MNINKKFLPLSTLKIIAAISMIIDHLAVAIYQPLYGNETFMYIAMRSIGNIAFPIYSFLLAEGFHKTKHIKQYILRCLLFGVISEIPFDFAIYGKIINPLHQNIYWTLCISLICMQLLNTTLKKSNVIIKYIFQAMYIGCSIVFANAFHVDYGALGVLFCVMFYYMYNLPSDWYRDIIGIVAFSAEKTAMLAFIPIHFYNGNKGLKLKWIFYLIYPMHLLFFGIIRFTLIKS